MKTFTLFPQQIYQGSLLLVNARYPLINPCSDDLTYIDERFPDILLKRCAANALRQLLDGIDANDSILPVSGYRSFEEQSDIFRSSMEENGEVFTRKFVALPNHSEHQTGLAIDLALNRKPVDFIRPAFPYTGVCQTFRRHAPDYGFIERYEKGMEVYTGIAQEPWHFRYVGYPHSKIIKKHGFCLEQYINFLKYFRSDHRYLYNTEANTTIEIYYVPACDGGVQISLSEQSLYQISGNNADGFIVTVWRTP